MQFLLVGKFKIKAMNCPNCNITLVMSDKQGIEIDYCPQCRGIWLDRGELDKIIERSSGMQDGSNYNPGDPIYNSHENKQYGYARHRKKGFLEQLFD
jgi:Zn-finger nucleic acid-binding protein